jgi:signal transduction histidine kinase
VGVAASQGGSLTLIQVFEGVGLLAALLALSVVISRPRLAQRSVRLCLRALLAMFAFNHLANLLEAAGVTWADTVADQLSLMVPVLWGLLLLETGRAYISERLRASDEQVRFFLENVPASVAWLDAECHLLGFSRAWKNGLPASEPGVALVRALPLPLPLLEGAIERSLRDSFDSPLTEETVQTSAGERRHFRWSTKRWSHPDRPEPGVLLLLDDITSEREAEATRLLASEELARTQRLADVGQLAAGAAHDFNNFLQIIQAASWELETEPSRTTSALSNIRQALDAAGRMTRTMLHFGSGQATGAEKVDLSVLVRELRGPLQHALGRLHRLEVVMPEHGDLIVWGSATRLQQAVLNLAINARDAMPHGGTIELSLGGDAIEIFLRVKDSGQGMSEEVRSKLFTPFFTTKGARGTGLGLRVVRSAVEEHKGTVTVESAPGAGTTFSVRLPRYDRSKTTT